MSNGILEETERLRKDPKDWGAISTLTTLGHNPLEFHRKKDKKEDQER